MGKVPAGEIRASIALAEKLARAELRKKRLEMYTSLPEIIGHEEETIRALKMQVAKDLVATQILPQARTVVRMREARERAITEDTVFGELHEAVKELDFIAEGHAEEHESSPFLDKNDNQAWQMFRRGLKEGDTAKVTKGLLELFISVKLDLVYKQLPPLPPPYLFDDQAYPSEKVN